MTFRRFDFSASAFTLIEMMIVLGIIMVLVAIALPTAFSLVTDSRVKQTKATMNTLAAAIEAFGHDNPFARNNKKLREITILGTTYDYTIPTIFDRYPPSPTAAFSTDPDHPETFVSNGLVDFANQVMPSPPYPATKENDTEDPPTGSDSQAVTAEKFLRLIYVMNNTDFGSTSTPWYKQNATNTSYKEYYSSIECLVLALTEFSSRARDIINQLQASGVLTNFDNDFTYHDIPQPGSGASSGNGSFDADWEQQATLFEVVDAWKKPLRYAIRENYQPNPNDPTTGFAFKWELRSAGEDGIFAPPFTPEDKCDDVILQGP